MKVLTVLLFLLLPQMLAAEACTTCHTDTQTNCGLSCSACHLSADQGTRPSDGHAAVLANPSLPQHWGSKCSPCHQSQITAFKNSKHYSSIDVIGQMRFLFGAADQVQSAAQSDSWKKLKRVGRVQAITMPELADNLLAKKCLRCHFAADGRAAAPGNIRAAGCAACHTLFDQQSGQVREGHKFISQPPDTVCLTCHSNNHVGGDSYGFFEHDYHNEYNTPEFTEPHFGAYQHRLAADVHQQAGMRCIDCHAGKHGERKSTTCQTCHGGFDGPDDHKNISQFSNSSVAHRDFHSRVRCEACHAQWSYQDYGLHLFLDESNHYQPWQNYLYQGDGEITALLKQQKQDAEEDWQPAQSANRLSGNVSAGAWYKAWTFRRWENPVLGIDSQGLYAIIRPLYQYRITYVDSADNLWFDSQVPQRKDGKPGWSWDVYRPHTIGKKGRDCESCHQNPKAVGMGIRHSLQDSAAHPITVPTEPIVDGARLLNAREQQQLLKKSERYKRWRSEAWRRTGIENWLKGN